MTRAKKKKRQAAPKTQEAGAGKDVTSKCKLPWRKHRGHSLVLDGTELASIVCQMFCRGLKPRDISCAIKSEFGIKMTREVPYQIIARAAAKKQIRYTPPSEFTLEDEIGRLYPRLQGLNVAHAAMANEVATCGAKALLRILQQEFAHGEVHVGFSGGHAMRQVAQHLAELLREPDEALPETIVFHALVSGFDIEDPTTDPNAFFTYFAGDPGLRVEPKFVGLHAPPFVGPGQLASTMKHKPIKLAQDRVKEVDVVVTSASEVKDAHNCLTKHMHISDAALREAGCVGDILWQPIGPSGPVDLPASDRALTLINLKELQSFVHKGGRVLLVAGPCRECHKPKSRIVEAVLRSEHRLITHLVTDSRCARDLLTGIQPLINNRTYSP